MLDFGLVVVDAETAGKTVTIRNTGQALLTLGTITCPSPSFVLCADTHPSGKTVAGGKELKFDVLCKPKELGSLTGAFEVISDDVEKKKPAVVPLCIAREAFGVRNLVAPPRLELELPGVEIQYECERLRQGKIKIFFTDRSKKSVFERALTADESLDSIRQPTLSPDCFPFPPETIPAGSTTLGPSTTSAALVIVVLGKREALDGGKTKLVDVECEGRSPRRCTSRSPIGWRPC